MNEHASRFAGNILRLPGKLILEQSRYVINPDSKKNIVAVQSELQTHPGAPFLMLGEHISHNDIFTLMAIYDAYFDPQRRRRNIFLVSEKMHRENVGFRSGVEFLENKYRAVHLSVIQKYMTVFEEDEEINKYGYTREEIRGNRNEFWKALLAEKVESDGNLSVIAFPSGTRGEGGKTVAGFEKYFHFLSPTIVVGVGLSFPGNYKRGLNLFTTEEAYVGEPVYLKNGRDLDGQVVFADTIMSGIRAPLPLEKPSNGEIGAHG